MANPAGDVRQLCMLLVEDEEIARNTLRRMLSMKYPGTTIYTAENGELGLELFRRHLPDVVVSDINMPALSGIDMARAILAEHPAAQVVFLTAHSEARQLMEAKEIGVPHYVLKPVDRHELFNAINGCLATCGKAAGPRPT